MASSSSPKPKIEIHRLAEADFLAKRPLILEDDDQVNAIAILNSPGHDAIEELILDLESSSYHQRLYRFCKHNYPSALSLKLLHLFLNSDNPDIKSHCADRLYFLFDSPCFWYSTSHVSRPELKIAILEILKQDNPKEISETMWIIASMIFSYIINEQGEWQDMLSFFFNSLISGTSDIQDYALRFFVGLPTCLCEELTEYVPELCLNFGSRLNSSNGEKKFLALAALVNLVLHMSSDFYYLFDDLFVPMIESVSVFLHYDTEEDNARRTLIKLAELVRSEPRFFDSHLNRVFDEMITIGETNMLKEEIIYHTVGMMYAFDDTAIRIVQGRYLGRLCFVLSRMISLTPGTLLGEDFMHRIALVRGNEIYMPLLLNIIPEYMASSDYGRRYASVRIIGLIAKGCAKAMSDNLASVMKVVLYSTKDPSPHVHFGVMKTVKAMSLELPPHMLDRHANFLITWLQLELADGNHPPHVQATAASVMGSLCVSCSSQILEPFLQTIVSKLLELIETPNPEVQAKSLKALASIARSSKGLFYKYYDLSITSLKKLLADATSISNQDNAAELHLNKAFECIWTVAMAVGKNIFKKDATEVVALLLSVRWYLGEDDHSLKVTLLQAWEQLLLCLGSHFYPYVKDIMPDLLRYARMPIAVFTQQRKASGSKSVTEPVILTEKLKACKLLLCLTRQFKGEFFPWIDQVSDIVVPLVKFHDANIRKIAFSAMPKLLLSAQLSIEKKQAGGATNSYLHKLVLRIVPSLLEALDKEIDGEICAKIVKSLTKCIEIAGGFLSKKKIQQTANAIEKVLKATSRKHFSEEENVTDLERRIIQRVVDYIGTLTEIYEESSWTFVNKFLACINAMMEDDVTTKEKEIVLLIFKEISLKCKEAVIRL